MILLSSSYLVTNLLISIYALLVVFVMFTFPYKNTPNSQLNLLNVFFLVILPTINGLCVMILIYIGLEFLEMSFFKKIHIFFPTNQNTPFFTSTPVLPLFLNKSIGKPAPQPLLVYQRHQVVPPNPPHLQGPLPINL